MTAAILVFIFAWNDLLLALTLTATKAAITAPVAIVNFSGSSQFEEPTGSIAAGAVVITVPIIAFVLIFQRRIVAGLTSGAVKDDAMAEIVLDHVSKIYPDGAVAVQDLNITIADGEFLILVGPSGCGKTTTLNMIAGLEDISAGELRIGGERVNEKAPKDRDIAMVFQSYALYPHMTVRQNIAFPLTLAKMPKPEIAQKVIETAKTLDLTEFLDRKPSQLSGASASGWRWAARSCVIPRRF